MSDSSDAGPKIAIDVEIDGTMTDDEVGAFDVEAESQRLDDLLRAFVESLGRKQRAASAFILATLMMKRGADIAEASGDAMGMDGPKAAIDALEFSRAEVHNARKEALGLPRMKPSRASSFAGIAKRLEMSAELLAKQETRARELLTPVYEGINPVEEMDALGVALICRGSSLLGGGSRTGTPEAATVALKAMRAVTAEIVDTLAESMPASRSGSEKPS